jgi:FkbM family methyltransferase
MASTTTLNMVGGVRIVVPDSMNLLTPYVLREQEDWFEDEIKFLRRLLQPGQKVIDIGANYGTYTLSMAKTVGPTGCVWAFEPASSTARLLAEGVAANRFSQVVLEQSALSSTCGTAQLSLNADSEMNALVHDNPLAGASESVSLLTLDECMARMGWHDIEFMKIDAEGEESNILRGGKRFFAELSPLVQYEIKAGAALHMELAQCFSDLGYDSYRLVPGLDLLVPFDATSPPDGYLLNLFCCKQDRAERLAVRGALTGSASLRAGVAAERFTAVSDRIRSGGQYGWGNTIARLPYGARLAGLWKQKMAEGDSSEVDAALSLYAVSRDSSFSSMDRFVALEASLNLLKDVCARAPSHLRLSSLARVARDYGARSLAANALRALANVILNQNQPDPGEAFLAPAERFDTIPPGDVIGDWVLAGVLEELERVGHYSSFYTGMSALQRLELIQKMGFGSAEMERRLHLLRKRFYLTAS